MSASRSHALFVRTIALFAAWLVLTQSFDPFYLTLGAVSALVVAWLNPADPIGSGVRWMGLVAYLPWLIWQVLLSGKHLAYLILHPRLPIDPQLIRYKTHLQDPTAVVIFGNSITLTPGTITAEASRGELIVHSMDAASASGLDHMERTIAKMFRVARTEPTR